MITKFEDFLNESKMVNFDKQSGNLIVMMGSPGAGKSFMTDKIINLKDWKYINVDTYRENMAKKLGLDIHKPEDNQKILDFTYTTSDPRNKTIKFLKKFLKSEHEQLPNIVFDAGGSQVEVIMDILDIAKNENYITTLIYVKTDLDLALKRNQTRSRVLADDMVEDYYHKCEKTFKYLYNYYDKVFIVNNNDKFDPTDRKSNIIQLK